MDHAHQRRSIEPTRRPSVERGKKIAYAHQELNTIGRSAQTAGNEVDAVQVTASTRPTTRTRSGDEVGQLAAPNARLTTQRSLQPRTVWVALVNRKTATCPKRAPISRASSSVRPATAQLSS